MKDGAYKFYVIGAFGAPIGSPMHARPFRKESLFNNFADVSPLLQGISWTAHPGTSPPYGDWPPATREEFAVLGVQRLPLVREACRSGEYDAIVLLGGGDHGFLEAREIAHGYDMPVTACGHSQMIVAGALGHRFSIICLSEAYNRRMAELVVQYRLDPRCASIRNLDFPLPRPSNLNARSIAQERLALEDGRACELLDLACSHVIAAIEEDGAETIMFGSSALYWLKPYIRKMMEKMGWDVPILEGHGCAIAHAKMLVDLGIDVSGIAVPRDAPTHFRSRKPA